MQTKLETVVPFSYFLSLFRLSLFRAFAVGILGLSRVLSAIIVPNTIK